MNLGGNTGPGSRPKRTEPGFFVENCFNKMQEGRNDSLGRTESQGPYRPGNRRR